MGHQVLVGQISTSSSPHPRPPPSPLTWTLRSLQTSSLCRFAAQPRLSKQCWVWNMPLKALCDPLAYSGKSKAISMVSWTVQNCLSSISPVQHLSCPLALSLSASAGPDASLSWEPWVASLKHFCHLRRIGFIRRQQKSIVFFLKNVKYGGLGLWSQILGGRGRSVVN